VRAEEGLNRLKGNGYVEDRLHRSDDGWRCFGRGVSLPGRVAELRKLAKLRQTSVRLASLLSLLLRAIQLQACPMRSLPGLLQIVSAVLSEVPPLPSERLHQVVSE
jgi:hypothetical protein